MNVLDGDILIKERDVFDLIRSQVEAAMFLFKRLDWSDSDLDKVRQNLKECADLLQNYS